MKNRRGVAGLISLIGLVIVFGIGSTAYLELTSSQTKLVETSIKANQKITDRNHEYLNFTDISNDASGYDVTVKNLSSETIILDSFLIVNGKSLEAKNFLDVSIAADDEEILRLERSGPIPATDRITIVSDTGKKCIFSGGVNFRIC